MPTENLAASDELASLLRQLGCPTQHFANPDLIRDLVEASNMEFYTTIAELEREVEFLAAELDRQRKGVDPRSRGFVLTSRYWDTIGRLWLALKMLVRARDNVEPQKEHVEEVVDLSHQLAEGLTMVGAR
jgi:hypothetical protein